MTETGKKNIKTFDLIANQDNYPKYLSHLITRGLEFYKMTEQELADKSDIKVSDLQDMINQKVTNLDRLTVCRLSEGLTLTASDVIANYEIREREIEGVVDMLYKRAALVLNKGHKPAFLSGIEQFELLRKAFEKYKLTNGHTTDYQVLKNTDLNKATLMKLRDGCPFYYRLDTAQSMMRDFGFAPEFILGIDTRYELETEATQGFDTIKVIKNMEEYKAVQERNKYPDNCDELFASKFPSTYKQIGITIRDDPRTETIAVVAETEILIYPVEHLAYINDTFIPVEIWCDRKEKNKVHMDILGQTKDLTDSSIIIGRILYTVVQSKRVNRQQRLDHASETPSRNR